MYGAYATDKYGPNTLNHCCGIPEIGQWLETLPSWLSKTDFPAIKNFKPFGCGIFVSTFLPSQQKVMDECEKYHTLLFKTGPHKNTGPDATNEGKEEGVYLCVFQFGKDK